jgi:DNA-binding NarL/FixJ family response regulator
VAGVIRVLVVDDHPVTARGVADALRDAGDIDIVGVAETLDRARALIAALSPDVVLCDVQVGSERSLGLPRQLHDPAPPILFFTSYDYPSFVRTALEGGGAGYVLKSAPIAEVVAAVRTVAGGGSMFAMRDLRNARRAPRMPTDRELEVIRRVALGQSNAEIGEALDIAERTVESHLRRLFSRYAVDSRTELTLTCARMGWIDLREL